MPATDAESGVGSIGAKARAIWMPIWMPVW